MNGCQGTILSFGVVIGATDTYGLWTLKAGIFWKFADTYGGILWMHKTLDISSLKTIVMY